MGAKVEHAAVGRAGVVVVVFLFCFCFCFFCFFLGGGLCRRLFLLLATSLRGSGEKTHSMIYSPQPRSDVIVSG